MFQLPNFTVVVWIRKAGDYPAIRDRLLELAIDDPYDWTEGQDVVDFHWGFDQEAQANKLADAFRVLVQRPELIVLRVTSRDGSNPPKTIKDERRMRR